MQKMNLELGSFMNKKEAVNQSYTTTADMLNAYEEENLDYYTNNDISRLVINNVDENVNLYEGMRKMAEQLSNPFKDVYRWSKGEIYDINAITAALD